MEEQLSEKQLLYTSKYPQIKRLKTCFTLVYIFTPKRTPNSHIPVLKSIKKYLESGFRHLADIVLHKARKPLSERDTWNV